MRLLAAILLASTGCSSETCDACPDGKECVAGRCRTPCVSTADCGEGEVCFRDYCEIGDLRPGADPHSGDPLAGDPHSGDPHSGDPHSGDPHSGDPHSGDPHSGDPPTPECGNNQIESGEVCDGTDLADRIDCTSFNWGSGPISCMVTCQAFDLSQCLNAPGKCPSGTPTGMQQCDTDNLRGESCESLGFSSGTLACNDNCSFDITGCVP